MGADLRITRLGFGCARLFAGSEMRASARLVETALEVGIRHFDTAPAYSYGQSEEVLGAVLSGVRSATITSKVGLAGAIQRGAFLGSLYRQTLRPILAHVPALKARLLAAKEARAAPKLPRAQRELTRDHIHRSLEQSLKRLRRPRLDILLIHEPDDVLLNEEAASAMDNLVRNGVVRAFGLGFGGAPDARVFGRVRQYRYDPHSMVELSANSVHLLHGVLRLRAATSERRPKSAPEHLRDVLLAAPRAGVVFSASHPRQIQQLARTAEASLGHGGGR